MSINSRGNFLNEFNGFFENFTVTFCLKFNYLTVFFEKPLELTFKTF